MNREATDLAGVRHINYETLGSTNAEALALARAGERGPLWVSARTQSAGRGRRGSHWVSAAGNLHATLLLSQPSSPAVAPQLSFVAALAGLTFTSPFGPVTFRAIDHQSTMGAYVGRTAVKDGKGVMVDWKYADGKDYLPSDADVRKMRPPQ